MAFLKRHWLFASAGLVVLLCVALGAFLVWCANQPVETKTVYVLPNPNPERAEILADATRPRKEPYHKPAHEAVDTADNPTVTVFGELDTNTVAEEFGAVTDDDLGIFTALEDEQPGRVSPFGFGPYPEVPADYPEDVIWENDLGVARELTRMAELMDRVLVKLWSQGHRVSSLTAEGSKYYPAYPNAAYVEWDYYQDENGVPHRYATRVTAGPGVSHSQVNQLHDGIIPDGITILSHDHDSINPYEFLNLQR